MILIASHRQHLGDDAVKNLKAQGYAATVISGKWAESCSQVWNHCIQASADEEVIICNEKARPKAAHVQKMQLLLSHGYGLVGLYRFGFFGLRKQLIREIGFFDERYVGGWHEDNDFIIRMKEADIAYFESEECDYLQMKSAWTHTRAKAHWDLKWGHTPATVIRLMPEDVYPYELGPAIPTEWLPWRSSVLRSMSGGQWAKKEVVSAV